MRKLSMFVLLAGIGIAAHGQNPDSLLAEQKRLKLEIAICDSALEQLKLEMEAKRLLDRLAKATDPIPYWDSIIARFTPKHE